MRKNPNGMPLMHAVCHPRRRHYAKNKCKPCWRLDYYGTVEWKAKKAAMHKAYYIKNRRVLLDKVKAYNVRRLYGMDIGEYYALLGGGCQICSEEATTVDHNHQDGSVRGALCHSCNSGLGMFRDSPTLLQKAVVYLGL